MGEITWGTLAATIAAPFVLVLPGWALLSLLLPPESMEQGRRPDIAAWLIVAAGLSLALAPVGLLLLYLAGIQIGPGIVLSYLALSVAVVLLRRGPIWLSQGRSWQERSWRERPSWLDAPMVALALVTLLIVGVRLWVVRGVNAGLWGDSYQHTMISQLILDNGGLFQSWEPYAPLRSLTYHFGLHSNVALFQWATGWLTGIETPRALVLVTQYLNGLAALALYPLTVRLSGGNRWAGVGAVLIAGLLTRMPMFYVNWGRYTQLTGQVILPVFLWFVVEAVEQPGTRLNPWVLAGVVLGGLGLTHYRILFFVPCFLLPYLAWKAWALRRERNRLARLAVGLAVMGTLSLALTVPWLWNLFRGQYPSIAAEVVADPNAAAKLAQPHLYQDFSRWLAWPLVIGAGLGALLALVRRQGMNAASAWTGCLFLLANPHWIGLPGTGMVDNFTVLIALYMPAAMLGGYLMGVAVEYASQKWRPVQVLVVVLILGVGLAGAQARSKVVEPQFQMVTPQDEAAMDWIRANTPPDARFLVNGFFAFDNHYVVGSDAGWWIPLLADRRNTVPPLLYASEASVDPDYVDQVNTLMRSVEEANLGDAAAANRLQQQGITHVYIGQQGGRIGEPDTPLLDAEVLRNSPYYQVAYHQDQVWVFKLVTEAEPRD